MYAARWSLLGGVRSDTVRGVLRRLDTVSVLARSGMSGNAQFNLDLQAREDDYSSEDEQKPSFRKSSASAPACCYCVEIEFEASKHAAWVLRSLELDPELRPQLVQRELEAHERLFRATFRGRDAHVLRTAINAFYEALHVAIQVLDRFQGDTRPLRAEERI